MTDLRQHPPQIVHEGPCPVHGGLLVFRVYWEKGRNGGRGGYGSSAIAHCPGCKRNVKRRPSGEIVTVARGDRKMDCAGGCGKRISERSESGLCKPCRGAATRAQNATPCGYEGCQEIVEGYRTYCSRSCQKAVAHARRRALKQAQGTREAGPGRARDERLAIAFRDGYRCHLCGHLVDLSLPPTHADAFTLDHIVPLFRGGSDEPENLATAHRRCNSAKGAR